MIGQIILNLVGWSERWVGKVEPTQGRMEGWKDGCKESFPIMVLGVYSWFQGCTRTTAWLFLFPFSWSYRYGYYYYFTWVVVGEQNGSNNRNWKSPNNSCNLSYERLPDNSTCRFWIPLKLRFDKGMSEVSSRRTRRGSWRRASGEERPFLE